MSETKISSAGKRSLPAAVKTISFLLLVVGLLGLAGSFFPPRDAKAAYGAINSSVLLCVAILILCNHRWALHFAFLGAASLTIGAVLDLVLSHDHLFSRPGLQQMMTFLFHTGLYWAAYAWYQKWRTGEIGAEGGTLDSGPPQNK